MSTNGYFFNDYNIPDALQELRETISNSKGYMELEEIQRHIDEIYPPALRELSENIQPYLDEWATATKLQDEIALYSPIFDELKRYEDFYDNAFASIAQNQAAMELMADIDSYAIRDIFYSFKESEKISQEINIDTASALYAEGKITDEDIAEEVGEMVSKKDFSFSDTWDNIKKSKWFLAIRVVFMILTFLASPAIDRAKDDILEKMRANEFWEESGVLEQIDKFFGIKSGAVSEQEAKDTVLEENIGNISKKKREDLLQKIQAIRDYISAAPQDENTGNLLAYLSELEKDVNGKKYGLVFEEHREEIDEVLDTHTPVLTEEKGLFIDNGGQMNFLIEGDNLAALKLLEKTHRGKIDLIYIDPPYNKGDKNKKDFIYDDKYVDKVDFFRHSKWASFLSKRLSCAQTLLSNRGIVFISIDDCEQASLRLICDDIFGENNFVSQLVWEKKKKGSFLSNSITNIKEYVLVYAKSISDFTGLIGEITTEIETYPCINASNKREIRHIPKGIKSNYKEPNWFLPSGTEISDTTMSIVLHSDLVIREGVLAEDLDVEGNWRYSQEAMTEYALKGELYLTRDLYLRRIVSEARSKMMKDLLPRVGDDSAQSYNAKIDLNNLFSSGWGSNEDADEELRLILGKQHLFDYPKPVRLIEKLIAAYRQNDITCLDFFAGSGTTGHAVIKLNAEDGGNRRFILCTNNENNICRDVTYERIKRVIDKESYAASLKYYRVDYVPIDERMYYEYADELLKHIRELVELENGVNFIGNAEIGIVLTEEELEAFVSNADAFSKCKKLYMGHDLLPTQEQEKFLEERGIEISIIPDYYYRDLQER